MKIISHRGLIDGPDSSIENSPSQILSAIDQGYDVEVDLRIVDSKFYLGHDFAQYKIEENFFNDKLWIHAKNLEALYWLSNTDLCYFWHQEDDFTLTSNNYIWTYPGKEITKKSIIVLPEWFDPELKNLQNLNCYGVCTDYANKIRSLYV